MTVFDLPIKFLLKKVAGMFVKSPGRFPVFQGLVLNVYNIASVKFESIEQNFSWSWSRTFVVWIFSLCQLLKNYVVEFKNFQFFLYGLKCHGKRFRASEISKYISLTSFALHLMEIAIDSNIWKDVLMQSSLHPWSSRHVWIFR